MYMNVYNINFLCQSESHRQFNILPTYHLDHSYGVSCMHPQSIPLLDLSVHKTYPYLSKNCNILPTCHLDHSYLASSICFPTVHKKYSYMSEDVNILPTCHLDHSYDVSCMHPQSSPFVAFACMNYLSSDMNVLC